jgi:AcrR family transcriptional regulator
MFPRRYHHGDLRATLLAAAEEMLREKGVAALSLRELARATGVSHAAPSRHFKDKQALLDALALVGFERMIGNLEQASVPGGASVQKRFTTLARAYLDFAVHNAELLEVMFARKHDPDVSDQLSAAGERMGLTIVRSITEAQSAGEIVEGDPWSISLVVGASLHGVAAFTANGTLSPEAAIASVDELVDHLLQGLIPR